VSDIKPLNWATKILALLSYLLLGFQVLYAGCSCSLILWCQSYRAVKHSPRSLHDDVSDCRASTVEEYGVTEGVHYVEPPEAHTFRKPLSQKPIDFGHRCFGFVSVYFNLRNISPKVVTLTHGTPCIYRVSQEERSIFWEVIVSVILSKKLYMNMSYSERFPRYSRLNVNRKTADSHASDSGGREDPHWAPTSNHYRVLESVRNRTHVHINIFA
jgi:hypothetical protein